MSDAQVRIEQLIYDYPGGVRALAGVDLEVMPGERLAIVGQNGSGKTTLIRHLNGLLQPTAGRVIVDGLDTRSERIARLARRVGLAFQDPDRQIFGGTVNDEVAFGARNTGLRGDDLESAVVDALAEVGLVEQRRTNPYDLGYSRRKLLTIASVLAMRTPIVVLDEPTTGQDASGLSTIQDLVGRLAEAGRTVICVSHDMRFVAESFDRVVVMRDGKIILDGTTVEAFAEVSWTLLQSTNLQPPNAARVGVSLGLGSTPTTTALVDALRRRGDAGVAQS